MFDTTGTKHFYQTLPCDDFKGNFQFLSRAKHPTWVLNPKGSETLPNLTIVNTPNGIWHFGAQGSLPKLLLGHNARLLNQMEANHSLRMMAEYAEEKSGLRFDAETATVYLVHYTYDVHLTEPGVWQMIDKLSKRKLKPFQKLFYEDTTIYFRTKSKTQQICAYPKLQEVLSRKNVSEEAIRCADGNLRFEHRLTHKSSIDALVKKHGLPNSYAQTLLTEEMSNLVISKLLDGLNFFDLLDDEKSTLRILRETYPTKKAMDLCGFVQMVNEYGENFFKNESLGISRDAYYRYRRACRKANVW